MNLTYCIKSRKPDGHHEGPDLPTDVFDAIIEHIAKEPDLLVPGPKALEMSYQDGYAIVVLNESGEPVGFSRLQFLLAGSEEKPAWMELGSTWVREDHRGNGVNQKMYQLLLMPHRGNKNILATTVNVASLAVGQASGFLPILRQQLPPEVWMDSCCCPLSKTHASTEENKDCILARGEPQNAGHLHSCWFRVTPETAQRLNLAA